MQAHTRLSTALVHPPSSRVVSSSCTQGNGHYRSLSSPRGVRNFEAVFLRNGEDALRSNALSFPSPPIIVYFLDYSRSHVILCRSLLEQGSYQRAPAQPAFFD